MSSPAAEAAHNDADASPQPVSTPDSFDENIDFEQMEQRLQVQLGDTLEIRVPYTQPATEQEPSANWLKDSEPVAQNGRNSRIHTAIDANEARLIVEDVEANDAGFYILQLGGSKEAERAKKTVEIQVIVVDRRSSLSEASSLPTSEGACH